MLKSLCFAVNSGLHYENTHNFLHLSIHMYNVYYSHTGNLIPQSQLSIILTGGHGGQWNVPLTMMLRGSKCLRMASSKQVLNHKTTLSSPRES